MPFNWSEESRRYRDLRTGRYLPAQTVRSAVDTVVSATGDHLRQITAQMRQGSLSIPAWQQQMAQEVKSIHLATAAASRGGWQQMSQADYGWVGQRLRTQYAYLNNFAAEVASGKQPLDGTLEARSALYAEAARSTSREMSRRMGAVFGDGSEANFLGPADHCQDCRDATGAGWVEIGTLPPVGARSCRSHCHCRIETRAQRSDAETATPEALTEAPSPAAPWDWADDDLRSDVVARAARPDWESSLSEDQKAAVKRYTTGGYRDLNEALREGTPLTSEQQQLSAHLDSVINAAGTYAKPVTVWRGIDMGTTGMPSGLDLALTNNREALVRSSMADYAEATFKPGAIVQLGGYQSTSFQINPALGASTSANSPGLVFEVRTARGAYISPTLSNYDDEAELLLGHDTRYRVVGVLRDVGFEGLDGTTWQRTVVKIEAL